MSACHLQTGRSIADCLLCRLPPWDREHGGGWLPCPEEVLTRPAFASDFSGDICADCGSPAMVRTGTCLTCQNCGSSSGGCS